MNWMPMRDFLRGGYKGLTEPTVISNHGRPVFTVFPHEPKKEASSARRAVVVRSDPGDSQR